MPQILSSLTLCSLQAWHNHQGLMDKGASQMTSRNLQDTSVLEMRYDQ